jgi:hypothetical protein
MFCEPEHISVKHLWVIPLMDADVSNDVYSPRRSLHKEILIGAMIFQLLIKSYVISAFFYEKLLP